MPIPKSTQLTSIPSMLAVNVEAYNQNKADYNRSYNDYIAARNRGIETLGSLGSWVAGDGGIAIQALLSAFGMNVRNSRLVNPAEFQEILSGFNPAILNWIASIALPLSVPPPRVVNTAIDVSLSAELKRIYNVLAKPGSVNSSGGFVIASKTMHCLFPELAPMIDGQHTGISYFHIDRITYAPPLGFDDWASWVGESIHRVVNPSPRGGGRNAWHWHQFMAAVGVNQHIYELWQKSNENPGLQAFLALDRTPGTTGIPRIVDKSLW